MRYTKIGQADGGRKSWGGVNKHGVRITIDYSGEYKTWLAQAVTTDVESTLNGIEPITQYRSHLADAKSWGAEVTPEDVKTARRW